jgi:hypothetical protein
MQRARTRLLVQTSTGQQERTSARPSEARYIRVDRGMIEWRRLYGVGPALSALRQLTDAVIPKQDGELLRERQAGQHDTMADIQQLDPHDLALVV